MIIRYNRKDVKIEALDISHIKSLGDYCIITMKDKKKYIVLGTTKYFEKRLPHMKRVHKSHIVNLSHAIGISRNTIRIENLNITVPIGRLYRKQLRKNYVYTIH